MAVEIRMPELGQTTDEVRLLSWLVKEGEEIRRGDPICEVENDKSVMPLESVGSGVVLKLMVPEDTDVATGTVIAVLGERGEQVPEPEAASAAGQHPPEAAAPATEGASPPSEGAASAAESTAKSEAAPGTEAGLDEGVRATRMVRHLAAKAGVDLRSIRGSGPGGLITRADLQSFLDGGPGAAASPTGEAAGDAGEAAGPSAPGQPRPAAMALSAHQQAVARSLSRSKTEIPHYYLTSRVEADALLSRRESHHYPDGSRVSFYALFGYAAARALERHARLNAEYVEGKLRLHSSVNMGIAVALKDELYVPVIREAGGLDIFDLDREIRRLVSAVRKGALETGAESGGTITLTNLGMYPVEEFCPIINPPQTAILGFGRIGKELHVQDDGGTRVRSILAVTGSFDHRVVNGAEGAAFLAELKRIMEEEL
jgi:pyruvate dehydrogenase E2 component (dihydrolipoamide acetyltransferase)